MGVTSPLFPNESSAGQTQSDGLSDDPEISAGTLDDTVFYIQTIAVPARREFDEESRRGQKLFEQAGCSSCHIPVLTTEVHPTRNESSLNNQVIFPNTDLLLHDMGDGLADRRPDFLANGREWRTSPLWGVGLTQTTNGHTNFLHDGRARTLEEAILWHSGEAENAKEFFRTLPAEDRNALIKFYVICNRTASESGITPPGDHLIRERQGRVFPAEENRICKKYSSQVYR